MTLEDLLSFSQDDIFSWIAGAECIWECKNSGLRNKPVQLGCCETVPVVFVISLLLEIPCGLPFFYSFDETVRNEVLDFDGVLFCLCRTMSIARLCPVSEWEVGNYVSRGSRKIIHSVWAYNTLLVERRFFPVRT